MSVLSLKETHHLTDQQVIGTLFQSMDEGKEFVATDRNYVWFYLIGKYYRPKRIGEMGTRFGYSLKAFVDGAGHNPEDYELWVYDAEVDGIKTLHIFEDYFRNEMKINNLHINRSKTQDLTTLGVENLDLCMVDAFHTLDGCYHECELAYAALRPGGVMVVDDVDYPLPSAAFKKFCEERNFTYTYLPSFRGIFILEK